MYNKHISEIETDFLQTICFFEGKDSDKSFAQQAIEELHRRNIEPELEQLNEKIILKYEDAYTKLNTQYLKANSFTILEFIWIVIFPLKGFILHKDEILKKKQKAFSLLISIILYATVIGYASYDQKIQNQEYVEQLNQEVIKDSIHIALQNWSGKYFFEDTEKKWLIDIKKQEYQHIGILEIQDSSSIQKLNCSVIVKDYGIQIFSNTPNLSLGINSHTDLLFELEKTDIDTLTWWHTLKPNVYKSINGRKGFKKLLPTIPM